MSIKPHLVLYSSGTRLLAAIAGLRRKQTSFDHPAISAEEPLEDRLEDIFDHFEDVNGGVPRRAILLTDEVTEDNLDLELGIEPDGPTLKSEEIEEEIRDHYKRDGYWDDEDACYGWRMISEQDPEEQNSTSAWHVFSVKRVIRDLWRKRLEDRNVQLEAIYPLRGFEGYADEFEDVVPGMTPEATAQLSGAFRHSTNLVEDKLSHQISARDPGPSIIKQPRTWWGICASLLVCGIAVGEVDLYRHRLKFQEAAVKLEREAKLAQEGYKKRQEKILEVKEKVDDLKRKVKVKEEELAEKKLRNSIEQRISERVAIAGVLDAMAEAVAGLEGDIRKQIGVDRVKSSKTEIEATAWCDSETAAQLFAKEFNKTLKDRGFTVIDVSTKLQKGRFDLPGFIATLKIERSHGNEAVDKTGKLAVSTDQTITVAFLGFPQAKTVSASTNATIIVWSILNRVGEDLETRGVL